MKSFLFSFSLLLWSCTALLAQETPATPEEDRPMGTMQTRWAEQVSPKNALPEYPRPQMVREEWESLNGLWEYAIRPKNDIQPTKYDGEILVPFPVESQLSGVQQWVKSDQYLWYKLTFKKPVMPLDSRLLLHFGAVDWESKLWINGKEVGEHQGGYDPFSFDITPYLKGKKQELILRVWDPTDTDHQARGKQVSEPRGIWYTAVTGIWQSVWLEVVPEVHITDLKLTPNVDEEQLKVQIHFNEVPGNATILAKVRDNTSKVISFRRNVLLEEPIFEADIQVREARLWSPEDPFLYDLEVRIEQKGKLVDKVDAYFGMRKISLGQDDNGHTRLMLNNEPYFQYGPLDQGWWPDGLYTAPTDSALRYDLEVLKGMGFNMLRKHVKVEPSRLYYHCDQLGLLVWQDMPSGFARDGNLKVGPYQTEDAYRPEASAEQFEAEWKAVMDALYDHPSIVAWVPFNEGWGQYETERINQWTQEYDPSRLVNPTSGWTDRDVGDIFDAHQYPGPSMEVVSPERATTLGEFGGLGWPVEEHLWWDKRNWGYRTYQDQATLEAEYKKLLNALAGLPAWGLSAAIYTQTTDVEGEVNGLMTYDREVVKFEPSRMTQLADELYAAYDSVQVWMPSSEYTPQDWQTSTLSPPPAWSSGRYDDSGWSTASGPFMASQEPALPDGSRWERGEMWLRKGFELESIPADFRASLFLNGESEALIFLNGHQIAKLERGTGGRHYTHFDWSQHAKWLEVGYNQIAVYLNSTSENHAFDMGVYSSPKK
ncbi:MAG: sugar-binding domain-containing protein [Bacteroidota bacterium]